MTTNTSTPAAGENNTIEAPAPAGTSAPVNVNLGLGDLIHGLLVGPKTETSNTSETPDPQPESQLAETPEPRPDDKPADKGPSKAELRNRVAELEAEKAQGAVLDGLRPKLAKDMEPVLKAILPTLDLSTPEAAKASIDQLSTDMPALFGPNASESKPTVPALPGALAHPGGVKTEFVGHRNTKGQIYK